MKKNIKRASIIIGILIALVLLVIVFCITVLKIDVFDPSTYTSSSDNTIFTKEMLDEIYGVELREDDVTFGDIECMKYWSNGSMPSKFDDYNMYLYVFESKKDAKKAYKNNKETSYRDIDYEGKDYLKGWLNNVFDGELAEYVYIHNNLIVVVYAEMSSEIPEIVNNEEYHYEPYRANEAYIDMLLRENF